MTTEKVGGNGVPNEQELALINQFSQRPLKAEEVYSFSVVLCDNEIDRDFERFSAEALNALAPLFIGKTGIFDHSQKGKDQTSRVYDTCVYKHPTRKTKTGEPYQYLKAKAYMVRSPKNEDLILEIDAGIKKEVSVSCSVEKVVCSVCGANLRKNPCVHVKGKKYGDKGVCHAILEGPTDAYEFSFVAVPAQPGAGVSKALAKTSAKAKEGDAFDVRKMLGADETVTLSKAEAGAIRDKLDALEKAAALGEHYLAERKAEVLRLGMIAQPGMDKEVLAGVIDRMDADELLSFEKAFAQSVNQVLPQPQLLRREKPASQPQDNQIGRAHV